MPRWNFNTPYRLLDARTACGLQIVVDDAAAALAKIPVIWEKLQIWIKNVGCAIDDCSVELAGIRFQEGSCYTLRWGLLLRFAAPAFCRASVLSDAAGRLKGFLCAYLKDAGIKFHDKEDDEAVLAHFPIWDRGTADRFYTGSFAKKAERIIDAAGRPITWYRELQLDDKKDLLRIFRAMERNTCCGLSFEIHRFPEEACRAAESRRVQDTACTAWLTKITEGKAVTARLMFWGDEEFDGAIRSAVQKTIPTLEQKRLQYTQELSCYMVYDPWAYVSELIDQTATRTALGAAKYALTLDEMQRLCELDRKDGQSGATAQIEPAAGTANAPHSAWLQSADQSGMADRVAEKVVQELGGMIGQSIQIAKEHGVEIQKQTRMMGQAIQLVKENGEGIRLNTEQMVKNTKAVEAAGEDIRQSRQMLSQIMDSMGELSGKMDKLAELAEVCERIVPAGCEISLTPEELHWLGVEGEEELGLEFGMEAAAVRLMKTALTLARLGMKMDEGNAALMAFSTPLGAFYEYMMRKCFNSRLYQRVLPVPSKKQGDDAPKPKWNGPDLGDFDNIIKWCAWPHQEYKEHALIDGETRPELYWLAWLNVMKPVREIRNKVHPDRGEASREELRMLYEVLLKPGMEPKENALKYGKYKKILFLCKPDGTWYELNEFLQEMNSHMEWFTPSLFHFILKCGKAEWV